MLRALRGSPEKKSVSFLCVRVSGSRPEGGCEESDREANTDMLEVGEEVRDGLSLVVGKGRLVEAFAGGPCCLELAMQAREIWSR